MIVTCPKCATRYELDAARLAPAGALLKCSRCHHTFAAPSASKKAPAPAAAPRRPPADENLTLPFEEGGWKDEVTAPPEFDVGEPEEGFTLGTEEEPRPPAAVPKLPDRPATPPRRTAPPPAEDDADEDAADAEEEEGSDVDEEEADEAPAARRGRRSRPARSRAPREERSHLGALFIFLGLVVFAYALLARALVASPALCDRLVGRLPLVGGLSDDRLLTRKVALSEVTGGYQRIKDGKDVFVITGKATNTAPVALHSVQINGKLYDGGGRTLDDKTIFCGNVISTKVLKDLTPREVSILQKLSPPKKFVIDPGESSTFVIVFMDPPRQAAQFTAQVSGAQRQA